ncbi:hypothetical protein FO519_001101 [Halicephalobus sp. NKZ332]|nr:hypothetical protein FO519_001101 [Halicephalobus sp. NKZ332]
MSSFLGRLARAPDLGITFHAVNEQDSANYQCVLIRSTDGIQTFPEFGTVIKLVVFSPPEILHPSLGQIIFAKEKTEIKINCEVDGKPKPHVIWTKRNQIVSLNSTLQFAQFSKASDGQYICHATNPEGTVNRTIKLLTAESPRIKEKLVNTTVVEGSSVHWHCSVEALPTNITYKWIKDDQVLDFKDTDPKIHVYKNELHITSAKKEDSGWYTCEADNGFPPTVVDRAFLNLLYRPKATHAKIREYILPLNGNVTLVCEVEANPHFHSVQWTKDGRTWRTTSTNEVAIINASPAHNGLYTCQGFNLLGGGDVVEIVVTVTEPLAFSKKPPPTVIVELGESAEIECEGFGYPSPVQYWLRNNIRISSTFLELKNITASDGGLYQCVLANGNDILYQDVDLFIRNTTPQCPSKSQISCQGETGFNISFQPGFDGGYPQSFKFVLMPMETKIVIESEWITEIGSDYWYFIDTKLPFSIHELWLYTKNVKGTMECLLGTYHVCTKVMSPSLIELNSQNLVSWAAVKEADNYVVAFRIGEENEFFEVGKTNETEFRLRQLPNTTVSGLAIGVKALRKPFIDSDYTLYKTSNNEGKNRISIILVIFSILLVCILTYFCRTRRNHIDIKLSDPDPTIVDNEYFSTFQRPPAVDSQYSSWRTVGSDENTIIEGQFEHHGIEEFEHTSMVNEIFRKYYMHNPEYNKVNLIDELRLAKLKQEMCEATLQPIQM